MQITIPQLTIGDEKVPLELQQHGGHPANPAWCNHLAVIEKRPEHYEASPSLPLSVINRCTGGVRHSLSHSEKAVFHVDLTRQITYSKLTQWKCLSGRYICHFTCYVSCSSMSQTLWCNVQDRMHLGPSPLSWSNECIFPLVQQQLIRVLWQHCWSRGSRHRKHCHLVALPPTHPQPLLPHSNTEWL